jgi:hypothetical protein
MQRVAQKIRHFVLLTAIGVTDPAIIPFNKATKGCAGLAIQGRGLSARQRPELHHRQAGWTRQSTRPVKQGLRIEQGDNWRPLLRSTLSRDDLALVLIESLA